MNSLHVVLRSVKSFWTYRSEIPASLATSAGPKSGSGRPSLTTPQMRANSLSAERETGRGSGRSKQRANEVIDGELHVDIGGR
jgi:hypothetical protein